MDEYENVETDNLTDASHEQGFLDKAMGKLKGNSKKKKFARGLLFGYGSGGCTFEFIGRKLAKKEVKDDDYITPAQAYENRDEESGLYKTGLIVGTVGGGVAGFLTFGLSYAAPHIAGFANRIHRKIKKGKKDGRY